MKKIVLHFKKIFVETPIVLTLVVVGVIFVGIYFIYAHPKDSPNPQNSIDNPYYVNGGADIPDLDNCPGGPYSKKCFDLTYGFEVSCANAQQEDNNFNLRGNICDTCGNGLIESGEQCDWGTAPTCIGTGGACNGQTCSPPVGGSCVYCSTSCKSVSYSLCGNAQIDTGEDCDSSASQVFRAPTTDQCTSLTGTTYTGGTLSCSNCLLDVSACCVPGYHPVSGTCVQDCPPNYSAGSLQFPTASPNTEYTFTAAGTVSVKLVDDCASVENNKISAMVDIASNTGTTAVVFVTDLSGSMDDTDPGLVNLKQALNDSIDELYQELPGIEIGLVSFNDVATDDVGALCTNSTCTSSEKSKLTTIVLTYAANGSTNTPDGILKARQLLDAISSTNKIMIIMSDGAPNLAGEDNAVTLANATIQANYAKNDPSYVKIYSAAFTTNLTLIENMRSWSSTANPTCNEVDYCYNSNNIITLYRTLINHIKNNAVSTFNITALGTASVISSSIGNQTKQVFIDLPPNFCSLIQPTNTFDLGVSYSGSGSIKFYQMGINYCPL